MSHREYGPATGTQKSAQTSVFDPLDRTVSESTTVGAGTAKATTFGYVGLTDQVITEEQPDSGGAPKAVSSYTYGPSGERISQTKTPLAGGASETSYYGLNPHTDVETLTSESGAARSTYRYSGYGSNDATGFTGKDKASATGGPEVEAYNPYRFNSKRWDPATAGYDMGFRDYSPGLNRFLTRDMYNGALADLQLGADPWNTNRYAFAGGNPITGIEFDGHISVEESYSGGKYGAALELCPDCHVELNPTGGDPLVVGADSKDSVNEAVDNIFVGMLSGAIKTLETAAQGPLAPAYHLSGAKTAGSQFDELAAEHGADTDSVAYVAGEIVGIPIPAGVGARTAGGGARLAGGLARGCFKSFSGETLVEMADGSHKPISQVKVGDSVLATDPETGERGPRKVTHLWVHSDTLTDLEVEGGEVITTTEDHPFWNATDHEFQRADEFDRGDQLLAADGRLVRVVGLRAGSQRVATAYNLTVDGIHTYYVLAGDTPVLVHNCGPNDLDPWQVMDRIDEHVLPLHGPGTEATGSKFLEGTTRENIADMVHEGLQRSASDATGNHPHLVDMGRTVGAVVTDLGETKVTTWVKIWMNDGRLGSIYPTLERP